MRSEIKVLIRKGVWFRREILIVSRYGMGNWDKKFFGV